MIKEIRFQLFESRSSVHTIEFYMDLTNMTFYQAKAIAFDQKKRNGADTYMEDGFLFVRMDQGIVMRFCDYDTVRLYLKINPRIVVENDHSYLGIFNASHENIDQLYTNVNKILRLYIKDACLENATLCRVDLCLNIESDAQEPLDELLRCLKRSDPRRDYTVSEFSSARRNHVEQNRHLFALCCKHYKLTVYDKLFERSQRGTLPKQAPKGLIRVEFSLQDEDAIAYYMPETSISTREVLFRLSQNSGGIISNRLHALTGGGFHIPLPMLRKMIRAQQGFKEKTKYRMCALAENFASEQNGERARRMFFLELPKKVDAVRYYTKLRRKFADIGANVIPLSEEWNYPLPSLAKIVDEILKNGVWVYRFDEISLCTEGSKSCKEHGNEDFMR